MKVVGMMIVGEGESGKWLEPCLDQWFDLVDDAVVVGNNTNEDDEAIIRDTGYWFYRDDREWGRHQPQMKADLLRRVWGLNPDWILPLDADEFYDKSFTRDALEKVVGKGFIGWYFGIVNLWGDEEHYRPESCFYNVRMFQSRPDLGAGYANKRVHCGLAPKVFYNNRYAGTAPHFVKHYGILTKQLRAKKTKRYEEYDPDARFVSREYYDWLEDEGYEPQPFDEDAFLEAMQKDHNDIHQNKKLIQP